MTRLATLGRRTGMPHCFHGITASKQTQARSRSNPTSSKNRRHIRSDSILPNPEITSATRVHPPCTPRQAVARPPTPSLPFAGDVQSTAGSTPTREPPTVPAHNHTQDTRPLPHPQQPDTPVPIRHRSSAAIGQICCTDPPHSSGVRVNTDCVRRRRRHTAPQAPSPQNHAVAVGQLLASLHLQTPSRNATTPHTADLVAAIANAVVETRHHKRMQRSVISCKTTSHQRRSAPGGAAGRSSPHACAGTLTARRRPVGTRCYVWASFRHIPLLHTHCRVTAIVSTVQSNLGISPSSLPRTQRLHSTTSESCRHQRVHSPCTPYHAVANQPTLFADKMSSIHAEIKRVKRQSEPGGATSTFLLAMSDLL